MTIEITARIECGPGLRPRLEEAIVRAIGQELKADGDPPAAGSRAPLDPMIAEAFGGNPVVRQSVYGIPPGRQHRELFKYGVKYAVGYDDSLDFGDDLPVCMRGSLVTLFCKYGYGKKGKCVCWQARVLQRFLAKKQYTCLEGLEIRDAITDLACRLRAKEKFFWGVSVERIFGDLCPNFDLRKSVFLHGVYAADTNPRRMDEIRRAYALIRNVSSHVPDGVAFR